MSAGRSSHVPLPPAVRAGIDAAVQQQISAAFNVMIQSSVDGETHALEKFVRFVTLVVNTSEIAERAFRANTP